MGGERERLDGRLTKWVFACFSAVVDGKSCSEVREAANAKWATDCGFEGGARSEANSGMEGSIGCSVGASRAKQNRQTNAQVRARTGFPRSSPHDDDDDDSGGDGFPSLSL